MTADRADGADLADRTATELLAGYAGGAFTPVDAVEACLRRIEALDPAVHAVRHLRADDALAEAAASAARWADGAAGPLDGVPYGLKDIVATAGVPTTGGSALYRDWVPDESAAHAARLAEAGGILLAKLETFEFACGGPVNRTFGTVRNPWDVARTTGGSSSGSGAAVAAGMMPLAIGTDTGGSIRIPSAYCGLTGLKPTYGRVPRHGVMGLSWTLDHAGPMTHSAADAALMMDVIAGHDPGDAYASHRPVPAYVGALDAPPVGARLGRLRGWFEEGVDPRVLERVDEAAAVLGELGYELVDVDVPDADLAAVASWLVCYPETLAYHAGVFDRLEERDEMGAALLGSTPFVSAADYLRALRYRTVFQRSLATALDGCAALLLAGAEAVAPPLDELHGEGLATWLATAVRLHIPFNYAGVPALCLPSGLVDGLPSSVQLVGLPHTDATLLAIAHHYQGATAHHRARPALVLQGDPS